MSATKEPFNMTYNEDGSITFCGTLPAHRARQGLVGLPLDAERTSTLISAAIEGLAFYPRSRERALVYTKLQEAKFWMGEANAVAREGTNDAG